MNKLRRKALREALELLEQAQSILEQVQEEEQEAFDNMPESLQQSERGETMEAGIYELEEAVDSVADLMENISSIVDG